MGARHRRKRGGRSVAAVVAVLCLGSGPCVVRAEIVGTPAAGMSSEAPPVSGRRGGPSGELPPLAPAAPPQSTVSPPPAPAAAPSLPLAEAPRFLLHDIKVEGNTVLDPAALDALIAPYRGKMVTVADLEDIRRKMTVLYIERGYINSGVVIPNQNVTGGLVAFRAVEGKVTGIEVTGTDHFKPDYFSGRLERGLGTPFNVKDAEVEQQILLQDPLVKRLNIELAPGLTPGEATMKADVLEGSPYGLSAQIANDQSPTVGEVRGQLHGVAANLLGIGDVLAAQYGRSDGLNDGFIAYSLPVSADDTRLNFRYDRNGTLVVDPALAPLGITSDYSSVSAGVSRPFYRTAQQSLLLGTQLDVRRAQSFLLDTPFPFSNGADANGRTNVTALRFYQSWVDRDADHALALRSTMSIGLHALGSTDATTEAIAPHAASSKFFSWLGQAQYVHRVFDDWEAVVRTDLQLSNHPLFPIEQFALGGIDTVRGYREYLTVTDDAFFASGELRIPVYKLRLPYLSSADEDGAVQLVPFYDFGRGWNVATPTPAPSDISSVGLGLRWLIGSGTSAEFYYGYALRRVDVGTSLQDRGIHFRVTTALY